MYSMSSLLFTSRPLKTSLISTEKKGKPEKNG
jgi:hypothetical protein